MSAEQTGGTGPPDEEKLVRGNGMPGEGLPIWQDPSRATGVAKGSDLSNSPSPNRPGGITLYGKLQEGMGSADPRAGVLEAVRERVHRRVITELGPVFYNNLVDQKELRSRVERIVQATLRIEKTPMSAAETARVAQNVTDDVLGYGPIERLVHDPTVSEIMVNGPDHVYVERSGRIEPTKISSSTRPTCAMSSRASSARSAATSTSPRPWWTPAWPTARASTPSSRPWPLAGRSSPSASSPPTRSRWRT